MKKQGRRLLSWLLAMTMLVSLFPASALAEAEGSELDDLAYVSEYGEAETPVYADEGQAAQPVASARMEATCFIEMGPEKQVEEIHEEPAAEGEEPHQHVHVSYPYHDWRAVLVVSFDRDVQAGSLGLATCSVADWSGFVLKQGLAAGQELELQGLFGGALTYGRLCQELNGIQVGVFNLSEENLGAEMTVELRLFEKIDGVETGVSYPIATYHHRISQVGELLAVAEELGGAAKALEDGSAEPMGTDEEPADGQTEQCVISLKSRTREQDKSIGRLAGGGSYAAGESVTVTAFPRKGYSFEGWYDASDTSFETMLSNQQSYTFTVAGDTSLVALFKVTDGALFKLTVHGSMYTVNNGAVQTDMATFTYNAGEEMFISFKDSAKEFLYWVNASGNILSTQPDFSFLLASDTEISSYYATNESADSSAKVIFRNAFKQVVLSRTYYEGQTISFPKDPPNRMGYVFKGWYIGDANGEPTATEATQESTIKRL